MSGSWTHDFNERLDLTNRQTMPGAGRESRWGHRGPSTTLSDVEEVEVIVAHHERATLRVGDVFLKIDADQTRTDVEIKAMTMAPIPTPELLWRKPPVLALAAVPGSALGRLGEPSTASSATWAAAGAAVRVLHEHARQALADPRLSKDMDAAFGSGDDVVAEGLPGPDFARHMLAVDPPDHTRLRRLVSAAFSTRRVEQLRPRVEEIVDELLDGIAARSDRPVDLVAEFALPLPFTVICELLGVPEQTRPALRAGLADLLVPTSDGDAY